MVVVAIVCHGSPGVSLVATNITLVASSLIVLATLVDLGKVATRRQ